MPPDVEAAFFKGYDFVEPDDPSVRYLLQVRVLMDWAAQPATAQQRNAKRQARLANLQRIAKIGLA